MRTLIPSLVAFIVYLAMACWRTWPLVTSLETHIASDPGDSYLLTWILAWDTRTLFHQPMRLFDGNIFYPHENVLAFSDHLLGALPVFAPFYLISGSAVTAYNLMFIVSFALSGWAAFALARHWTRAFWPSLAAGALFGFALYRLAQISHAQLLNFFWAPLALLFLDRFIRDRRWGSLAVFALFSWLQILASFYLGAMFAVAVALYLAYAVLTETTGRRRLCVQLLVFAGASALVLVPLHLPYLAVRHAWRASRPIPEVLFYTPDILNFLAAPPLVNSVYISLLLPLAALAENEKHLFPGLLLPILVLVGMAGRVPELPEDRVQHLRRVFVMITVVGLLLALGPYLIVAGHRTLLPLPYLAFYKFVPGWAGMRVPGRFVLLATLGAIPLTALGCLRCAEILVARRILRTRWASSAAVATIVISLVVVEIGLGPFPMAPAPADARAPEVYRWLAREQPGPIVELPFGLLKDYRYLFLSTVHWLPLVNGQSGFFPPSYSEIEHTLTSLPARPAVDFASALGVRAIVVHTAELSGENRRRWFSGEPESHGLTRGAQFGPDIVYLVPPARVTTSLRVSGALPAVLPAGARLRLPIAVEAGDGEVWRHPRPHGFVNGLVEWTGMDGVKHATTTATRLPVALPAGAAEPIALEVKTPARAGRYRLDVSIPALGLSLVRNATVQIVLDRLLDSRNDRTSLAATYDIDWPPEPPTTLASDRLMITLTARNTGQAIWLAGGRDGRGAVRLGWRWFAGGHELHQLAGRLPLSYDVHPGQRYRFRATVETPAIPGVYVLEFSLVSEGIASFFDIGTPALRMPVSVASSDTASSEVDSKPFLLIESRP